MEGEPGDLPQPREVIGCTVSPCRTWNDCHLVLRNSAHHAVGLTLNILNWEAEFTNRSSYYYDYFPYTFGDPSGPG